MVDLSILVPVSGVVSLAFAALLTWDVLRQPKGDEAMRRIAKAVEEGARAFMRRQYTTIAYLAALIAIVFAVALGTVRGAAEGLKTAAAFSLGATFSAISGYVGLHVSIRANSRTANNSLRSLDEALRSAIRGGAVSGLIIIALSLLGVWGIYHLYGGPSAEDQGRVILSIVGFGFGASLVALFAQLGGGIYTKAADVGADLVGKVEAGIPEDDPRNPAVIADLVGDNVGDCAGRGADLFESTAAENIGAMVLGVALIPFFGINGVMFPLVARAMGLMATVLGVLVVKTREEERPMSALNRGYFLAMGLTTVLFALASWQMLSPQGMPQVTLHPQVWLLFFLCGLVGILTSLAFVYVTQYYTEGRYRPVKEIARSSQTGAATNIISGFAVGLEATAIPGIVISAAILISFYLGQATGISEAVGGTPIPIGGLYGTAVATMGMLSTAAYILAMDTFGPIADNAAGIVEMSGKGEKVRSRMDGLDAAGNTTKALTKGYAVGSAALAAFLLFSAYLEEVRLLRAAGGSPARISIDLSLPPIFVGAIVGVILVFLFSALAIRAVGRAAYYIINDVRDQFRENPEIMKGNDLPDYARSVDICTRGALKEMVAPGILAVAGPVLVGIILKPTGLAAEAVGATLMVGTIAGVILALVLNTGGGAWDNAKKLVESGLYGGKGTDTHRASVVGDTVGDPLKDTAGPSLHILVKLLSTITLVLAPLFL
ncbi:MAG: sodium-translocating pyrophosphatase [Thermoplasmata archaeon]